jgi:hypothetical protein
VLGGRSRTRMRAAFVALVAGAVVILAVLEPWATAQFRLRSDRLALGRSYHAIVVLNTELEGAAQAGPIPYHAPSDSYCDPSTGIGLLPSGFATPCTYFRQYHGHVLGARRVVDRCAYWWMRSNCVYLVTADVIADHARVQNLLSRSGSNICRAREIDLLVERTQSPYNPKKLLGCQAEGVSRDLTITLIVFPSSRGPAGNIIVDHSRRPIVRRFERKSQSNS